MRCLGQEFIAFNPLNFLYIVANNKLVLTPENRTLLARIRDISSHSHPILAYSSASFKGDEPDSLKICQDEVLVAERGNVIITLPKENDFLQNYIMPLGLEKITEEQFDQFIIKQ